MVGDFFLSETAELADVVLPTAQWAEEEGTMTNLEGRVILRRRAIDPPQGVGDELAILGELAGIRFGLRGRVMFLGIVLLFEGMALILFSQMASLFLAIGAMILFSLFVQMSEGATYSVVPFINRRALGSVAGIVGAGGNAGAVAYGFLFRIESLATADAFMMIGIVVLAASVLVFLVRFSPAREAEERQALELALASRTASGLAMAEARVDR